MKQFRLPHILLILMTVLICILIWHEIEYASCAQLTRDLGAYRIDHLELNHQLADFFSTHEVVSLGLKISVVLVGFICLLGFIRMLIISRYKNAKLTVIAFFIAAACFGYYHARFVHLRFDRIVDNKGLEWYYYGEREDSFIGYQRNPLFIASQAITYYDEFKETNDEETRTYFHNCINYLMEDKVVEGDATYFTGDFDLVAYDEPAGWKCGLTNSRVILAMMAAHEESGDTTYLEVAHSVLFPFTIPITKGGLVIKLSDKSWWFCEYPKPNGDSPMVLNGKLSILIAMHKYYEYSNDELAMELYEKGLVALKDNLARFDDNGFSFYDLKNKSAGKSYHMIHISLLKQLYAFEPDPLFETYRVKWQNYATEQDW